MSWNQNGLSSDSHLTLEVWQLPSWCHIPIPPKTLQYCLFSCPCTHFFFVHLSVPRKSAEGAKGRTWGAELGQYFSKCPSENGQRWIPRSLVAVSVPQNLARGWDLLYTHRTAATDLWTNCSTSSAHEQFVHLVLQKKKKKKPF